MNVDPRQWLGRLAPREQRFVLVGAVVAAVLLLAGGLWRLHGALEAAERRVAVKTADLAWMQSVAPAVQAAPAQLPGEGESLPLLIDRTAREAGLATSLAGAEPAGASGVRVRFKAASFDAMVAWIATLQSQHRVTVGTASIERLGSEGTVNATILLQRS